MQQWIKELIFYEIYPNSFKDSNGDGYGDINGIIEKLDYVKGLGVNAIWLNPHYDSPFKDGGYDVRDFFHTSLRFGTDGDFLRLINEIHDRGMKLIIDLVAGHTSEENEMFLKSTEVLKNEYSDMFIWTDNPWESDYKLVNGRYNRNGAYMVNFFITQPALNYGFNKITRPWQMSYEDKRCLKAREFIISVIEHYLSLGVDGFRVDMADSLVKNDDEKYATIKVWQDIFSKVKNKYPNAIFVSEWWNPYKSFAAGFDCDFVLDRNDAFFNDLARREHNFEELSFLRLESTLDITNHLKEIEKIIYDNKDKGYLSFISCNHDTPRPAYFLNQKELRMYYVILFTLPGVPFLYYGDEIGMTYQKDLASVECGYSRTGSRTPMSWNMEKNNGFSKAKKEDLFLPIDNTTSVEKQQNDENSLYHLIVRLIELRKNDDSLKGNNFKVIYNEDKRILMYERNDNVVIINPSKENKKFNILGKIVFADGYIGFENNNLIVGSQSSVIIKK